MVDRWKVGGMSDSGVVGGTVNDEAGVGGCQGGGGGYCRYVLLLADPARGLLTLIVGLTAGQHSRWAGLGRAGLGWA